MFDVYEAVWNFHEVYDCARSTIPVMRENDLREMRHRILEEEVQEYFKGEREDDIIEIADALADIVYVAYGTGIVYGFNVTPPIRANKTRETPHLHDASRDYCVSLMQTAWHDYDAAEKNEDVELIAETLVTLVSVCEQIAADYGIPLDDVIDEVHRSNMSKLDENGRAIKREDGKVLKGPNYFKPNIGRILAENGYL